MEPNEFIRLVEEILEVDSGTVTVGDSLDAIDWDSLADLGFIAEIDSRFSVALNAQKLAASTTVDDLYRLVTEAVGAEK